MPLAWSWTVQICINIFIISFHGNENGFGLVWILHDTVFLRQSSLHMPPNFVGLIAALWVKGVWGVLLHVLLPVCSWMGWIFSDGLPVDIGFCKSWKASATRGSDQGPEDPSTLAFSTLLAGMFIIQWCRTEHVRNKHPQCLCSVASHATLPLSNANTCSALTSLHALIDLWTVVFPKAPMWPNTLQCSMLQGCTVFGGLSHLTTSYDYCVLNLRTKWRTRGTSAPP